MLIEAVVTQSEAVCTVKAWGKQ